MSGATLLATVTASTKRYPAISAGLVGAPATNLASLALIPLRSVSPELAQEAGIQDVSEAFVTQAFYDTVAVALPDVREGDIVTISSADYTVRSVAEYNDGISRSEEAGYMRIILQQRKIT